MTPARDSSWSVVVFSRRDADDERTTICIGDSAYSRVVESHRFIIGTLTPEHDSLVVGGEVAWVRPDQAWRVRS